MVVTNRRIRTLASVRLEGLLFEEKAMDAGERKETLVG
jgi:hypothetical protein